MLPLAINIFSIWGIPLISIWSSKYVKSPRIPVYVMSKHCKQFDHRQEKDKTVALNIRLGRIKFRHSTCVWPNPARTNQQRGMGHSRRYWWLASEGSDFLTHAPDCDGIAFQVVFNANCKNRNIDPWPNLLRQRHLKKGSGLNTCGWLKRKERVSQYLVFSTQTCRNEYRRPVHLRPATTTMRQSA